MITRLHENYRSPRRRLTEAEDRRYKALPAPGRPDGRGWEEPRPCEAPDKVVRFEHFRGRQGGRVFEAVSVQSIERESCP